ncbi:MAG: bifunctional riboflavin kinase/FAD synthetase [Clostridia bacterium]|nr:bifunctional riboflavin kinase/FAD synthetase [Clostridia bacterium]
MTDEKLNNGTAVALGNFDGIHLGHSAVLEKTVEMSKDTLTATVMLFDEHSLKAVSGEAPPMLMTDSERLEFLTQKGLRVRTVSFADIRSLSPEDFVKNILVDRLNAKAVVCGFNYRFGKGASGDAKLLKKLCKAENIECITVDEVLCDSLPVSSTAIRKAIENGDIVLANNMLGRAFGFGAVVVDGEKRGRTWGFPTINQHLPDGLVVPRFGVYESRVTIDGKEYKGVTNIGKRPTVGTDTVLSETHIIDFSGDLYGRDVFVSLIRFIRPEKKFSSFDKLALQIKNDCLTVKGGV